MEDRKRNGKGRKKRKDGVYRKEWEGKMGRRKEGDRKGNLKGRVKNGKGRREGKYEG